MLFFKQFRTEAVFQMCRLQIDTEIKNITKMRALEKFVTSLSMGKYLIWCGTLSSDGKKYAYGTFCGHVLVYDTKTGNQVAKFEFGHRMSLNFSRDGNWLAVCAVGKNFVDIFDLKLGHLAHKLKGHTDSVHSALFSPDNETVACCFFDGSLRIWNYKTGQFLRKIVKNKSITDFCFSPNGNTIACVLMKCEIQILNYENGDLIQRFDETGHASVSRLYFSPDGNMFAASLFSNDGNIYVWNLKEQKLISKIKCGYVRQLAFSFDGKTIEALVQNNCWTASYFWKIDANQNFKSVHGSARLLPNSIVSQDGTTIARSFDRSADRYVRIDSFWHPLQQLLQQHVVNLSKCRHLSSETIFIIFKSLLKRKGYLNFFFDEMFLQFISTCKKAI